MGCDAVCWQGVTTLRANARKEEQRRQSAVARLNRVRSALTRMVTVAVVKKDNVHTRLLAELSGRLRFLGSIQETLYLLSAPCMRESIRKGMTEPLARSAKELKW